MIEMYCQGTTAVSCFPQMIGAWGSAEALEVHVRSCGWPILAGGGQISDVLSPYTYELNCGLRCGRPLHSADHCALTCTHSRPVVCRPYLSKEVLPFSSYRTVSFPDTRTATCEALAGQ